MMKKIALLVFMLVLFSSSLLNFAKPITAKTYYLSVDIGDWVEYLVEEAPQDCLIGYPPLQNASAPKLGDRIRFSVFNKTIIPHGTRQQETALFHVYLNDEKIYEASRERYYITVYVSGFALVGLNPFFPTGEEFWEEVYSPQKHNFTDSLVIYTAQQDNGTLQCTIQKKSGIVLDLKIHGLYMQISDTNLPDVIDAPTPLWLQWWFWAIVSVIIIAVVGAIYLLKRGKPPISTVPPLPSEGIT